MIGEWSTILGDTLSSVLALAALAFAIGSVIRGKISKDDRMSIVWACLALGMLSWFSSEVAWILYPVYWGIPTPQVSIADVFGVGGYLPAIIGLLFLISPYREVFHSKSILVASLSTLVTSLALSAPPIFATRPSIEVMAVGLIYVILDVSLLSIAVPILLILRKGSFWKPFLLLVSGVILALFSHIISNWIVAFALYYPWNPSDLLLDAAYLLGAAGFSLRIMQLSARAS